LEEVERKMKRSNILKRLVLTTITLLLLCNLSGIAFGINESAEKHIMPLSLQNVVWVNDDYPWENSTHFKTIQGGVNAVNSSGTIGTVYVCNGTYNESIIIKKPVRIIGFWGNDGYGNDSYPPIVYDPSVAFMVIGNNASGTNISHFSITGGSVAGILVLASKSINISFNNIFLNRRGIYIMSSPYCTITHNNAINNTHMGISLENANHCNILWNWVADNKASGIDLSFSNYVDIKNNHMQYNGKYNIWIGKSNGTNNVTENNIIDNETIFKSKPCTPRWYDSLNYWNNNYWSQFKGLINGRPRVYPIWGLRVFVYSLTILWPFPFDIAVNTQIYNYGPNEI
jgi:parallel beta-helix repeat protein